VSREHDLFANFERMRREIDELFGDVFERSGLSPTRGFAPRVDVYYTGQPPRAVVVVDLAGIDVEAVSLEIHGRQLTISGERRQQDSDGRLYQQLEIPHGPFRRVVELGADVAADAARATYEDGMLRVEIPLIEQRGRTRSVQIRSVDEDDEPGGGGTLTP
jgi:HSP20 family protein